MVFFFHFLTWFGNAFLDKREIYQKTTSFAPSLFLSLSFSLSGSCLSLSRPVYLSVTLPVPLSLSHPLPESLLYEMAAENG